MLAKIQKWGNSLALRIPKSFASQINLDLGSPVDLSLEKNVLIIKPLNRTDYSLDELLSKIDESNTHYEIDTGKPQGKELW